MEALRRWNVRRRSPSVKAMARAGPPIPWLVVAGGVGLVAIITFWLVGIRDSTVLIALPLVTFTVACLVDRDGWRTRMATAELAGLQVKRWAYGRIPSDPATAASWLEANPDAPAIDRATVMVTENRLVEARDLLVNGVASDPAGSVRLARIQLTIAAALGEQPIDGAATEAFARISELDTLPPAERRYQRLALAWSAAWLAIRDHRHWRDELARALRDLGPFRPPARYVAFHTIQHFALPIAYVLSWVIVGGILGGRTIAALFR